MENNQLKFRSFLFDSKAIALLVLFDIIELKSEANIVEK